MTMCNAIDIVMVEELGNYCILTVGLWTTRRPVTTTVMNKAELRFSSVHVRILVRSEKKPSPVADLEFFMKDDIY